jgi:hypothetical protein
MQGDSYPREVVVSILTDQTSTFFGDHTGEFSRYLRPSIRLRNRVSMVQSKRRFKKIVACSRCTGFIKILFKMFRMTSKRAKKHKIFGRMNSLVIPLKELLKS